MLPALFDRKAKRERAALVKREREKSAVGLPSFSPPGSFVVVTPDYDAAEAAHALTYVKNINRQYDALATGMMQWLLDQVAATGLAPNDQQEILNAVVGRFQVVYTDYVHGRVHQPGAEGPLKDTVVR